MSFVSETDVSELKKHNINYETDIIVFINEMKQYFYNTWTKEYHKDIDNRYFLYLSLIYF